MFYPSRKGGWIEFLSGQHIYHFVDQIMDESDDIPVLHNGVVEQYMGQLVAVCGFHSSAKPANGIHMGEQRLPDG